MHHDEPDRDDISLGAYPLRGISVVSICPYIGLSYAPSVDFVFLCHDSAEPSKLDSALAAPSVDFIFLLLARHSQSKLSSVC